MENNDKGFGNFRTGGAIQNTFQQGSSPTKNSRNTSHQTGHEGCIFLSTTSSILKTICQIFMIREPLRVPLPMFWLRSSNSSICKTFKSPYISTEANKYLSDNITRRYAFDGINKAGNFNVLRYNHLPSATWVSF